MMWGVALVFVSCVAAQVSSHAIRVECRESDVLPPTNNTSSPSFLADLKVELVTVGGIDMVNVSWAINIDASIKYLTGTRLIVEETYHCDYNPPLAKADVTGSKQKWFHYLVRASYGSYNIQAANLPLPPLGSGIYYKITKITIPHPKQRVKPKTTQVPIIETTAIDLREKAVPGNVNFTSIAVPILGGLAGLMICYIIYKMCGSNFATSLSLKRLPTSILDPIPVLVVYPAENSSFQRAVVALADFLQWHGGCSVAVDVWQQGKIAELGPMRWLAEQAKAADRVLIVCPQSSLQPSHSLPNHSFPEPSISAAAHDLYPLILNMVASHATDTSDLAKFWVVQLGKQQDKRLSNLAPKLRSCKTFCLTKDLNKLCRSLHTQRQGNKEISDLIFRPGIFFGEKSTMKLREAVEKLGEHQPSVFIEMEPLKSVVTTI